MIRRASEGDQSALDELFGAHRERLKRMIRLRIDRRIQGRLDSSDVLQEAYIDVFRNLPEYVNATQKSLPTSRKNSLSRIVRVSARGLTIMSKHIRTWRQRYVIFSQLSWLSKT